MNNINNKGHANVLLIEDNHADIRMIKEIFKEVNTINMDTICNGVEALNFLNNTEPNLILLDLNIPLINGFEVLKKVKKNDKLNHIPIIVLTTSRTKEDFLKAQKLQADCFITKPMRYDDYKFILHHIADCWLK